MRGRQTRRVGVRFQAGVRKLQNYAFLPAVGFGIPAYLLGRYESLDFIELEAPHKPCQDTGSFRSKNLPLEVLVDRSLQRIVRIGLGHEGKRTHHQLDALPEGGIVVSGAHLVVGQKKKRMRRPELGIALVVGGTAHQGVVAAHELDLVHRETPVLSRFRGPHDALPLHFQHGRRGGIRVLRRALVKQKLHRHRRGITGFAGAVAAGKNLVQDFKNGRFAGVAFRAQQNHENLFRYLPAQSHAQKLVHVVQDFGIFSEDLEQHLLPLRAGGIQTLPFHGAVAGKVVLRSAGPQHAGTHVHHAVLRHDGEVVRVQTYAGNRQTALMGKGQIQTGIDTLLLVELVGRLSELAPAGIQLLGLFLIVFRPCRCGHTSQTFRAFQIGLGHVLHTGGRLERPYSGPELPFPFQPAVPLGNEDKLTAAKRIEENAGALLPGLGAVFHKALPGLGVLISPTLPGGCSGLRLQPGQIGRLFLGLALHFRPDNLAFQPFLRSLLFLGRRYVVSVVTHAATSMPTAEDAPRAFQISDLFSKNFRHSSRSASPRISQGPERTQEAAAPAMTLWPEAFSSGSVRGMKPAESPSAGR